MTEDLAIGLVIGTALGQLALGMAVGVALLATSDGYRASRSSG